MRRREAQRKHYYKRTEGKVKRRAECVPIEMDWVDMVINLGIARGYGNEAEISRAIGLKSSFLSDCSYRIRTYGKFSIQKPHYELIEDWIKNGKEAG